MRARQSIVHEADIAETLLRLSLDFWEIWRRLEGPAGGARVPRLVVLSVLVVANLGSVNNHPP